VAPAVIPPNTVPENIIGNPENTFSAEFMVIRLVEATVAVAVTVKVVMSRVSLFHYLWLNVGSNHVAHCATACYTSPTLCKSSELFRKVTQMKFINPETKTFRVFQALQSGKALTASQASKMGVKNLSAEVSRIRSHGFAVYTNSRKAGNGVNVTEYVIGKPSRKLVAAGYRALALGL
jgi:hypothetical protein